MAQPKRRRIEQVQTSSNFTDEDIPNENLMDQALDLFANFFGNQDEKSDMSTLDTKPIFKEFYTEFPNPTDDEIEILHQMIQQENPSEKIQKWFPKVFGYAKSIESPAPRFARLLNFKRCHIKKHN